MARAIGYEVRIYYRPRAGKQSGLRSSNFAAIRGTCEQFPKRKIVVSCYGRQARRNLLFVLAHEVRHALHVRDGIFADYYRPYSEDAAAVAFAYSLNDKRGLPKNFKLPNLSVAIRAERDCDKWAAKFLRERGISASYLKYEIFQTAAFDLHVLLARNNFKMYLDTPGSDPRGLLRGAW